MYSDSRMVGNFWVSVRHALFVEAIEVRIVERGGLGTSDFYLSFEGTTITRHEAEEGVEIPPSFVLPAQVLEALVLLAEEKSPDDPATRDSDRFDKVLDAVLKGRLTYNDDRSTT